MEKGKKYVRVKFSADTLKAGIEAFLSLDGADKDKLSISWKIIRGAESWSFDTEEEFFAEYRSGFSYARFSFSGRGYEMSVTYGYTSTTEVSVTAPSRPELERVFWPFERDASSATIEPDASPAPEIPKPVIFIGHGRSSAWRDLKDHLVEQH